MNVREELLKNQDVKYKEFHCKLIPNVDSDKIIGVRIPQLRKIGKALPDNDFAWDYYEEIMLHGFFIGYAKLPFEERISLLDSFVPKIDNWAVCDCVCLSLKFINKNKAVFLAYLKKYMNSENEYEIRFSIVILMDYYLDDEYSDLAVNYLKNIKSEYYYVNMAAAWALSVAFVKYREKIMPLIENHILSKEIHNMTISKIRDSFRVDKDTKALLKTLKRTE